MELWPISDWVSLLLRWTHVVAGIAWIGSSFYFVALDAGLKRRDTLDAGVGGEAWQVHGGGFYRMQKYLVAPSFPAGRADLVQVGGLSTWIFGFALLVVSITASRELYLIDPLGLPIWDRQRGPDRAADPALGWLVYDSLCRSPLGRNPMRLTIAGLVLLLATIWGLDPPVQRPRRLYAGRRAGRHDHGRQCLLRHHPQPEEDHPSLLAGETPDPASGVQGKQRSLHNNYLTLPVVFLMISNHYPSVSSGPLNWIVISGVFVVGFLVRHFFNLKHSGGRQMVAVPGGRRGDCGADHRDAAAQAGHGRRPPGPPRRLQFAQVQQIVETRCQVCHSATPRFPGHRRAAEGRDVRHAGRNRGVGAANLYSGRRQPCDAAEQPDGDHRGRTPYTLGVWIAAGSKLQ
jgi:uncharacterized membrane protein